MIIYYLLQKSQLLNGFLFLKIQSLYLRIQFNQEHQNQNGQESKLDISLSSTYNAESANTFERRPGSSSLKNKKQSKVKPNHKAIAGYAATYTSEYFRNGIEEIRSPCRKRNSSISHN